MKLARFRAGTGEIRLGRVDGDRLTDLTESFGTSLRALLPRLPALRPSLETAGGPTHALADVTLEAPIDDPQKYLAIGMNYKAHAEEARAAGIPVPAHQMWFNNQVSCITGAPRSAKNACTRR